LTEGEDDGEELLRGLVEFTVGFEVKVDIDQMGTGEKLAQSVKCIRACVARHTWKTIPEEMIGVVPSSISVPLLLANIIRSQ
jgi:hypothetical protein